MKTILAIDDSEDILFLEKMVLTKAGYIVHTALSGTEGLKKITELTDLDLILLDYEMAPMNGPGFLKALQLQSPTVFEKTKIVFASAHENPPSNVTQRWIPKIRDIDEFIKNIAEILHYS